MGDMFDGADTVVLHEELAYQDLLPVAWEPLERLSVAEATAALTERNVRVLQACAALDEQGPVEKPDESAPHSADLLRIELKINLLLDMLGQVLAANRPRPPAVAVRFNAHGIIWRATPPLPRSGEAGIAAIYLRDCIAEPLRLAGRVTLADAGGEVRAEFAPPAEAVADLIEKLAFRRHRRQVAGTRQPRRG